MQISYTVHFEGLGQLNFFKVKLTLVSVSFPILLWHPRIIRAQTTYQTSSHHINTKSITGPYQCQPPAVRTVLHPDQSSSTLSWYRCLLGYIHNLAGQLKQSAQCSPYSKCTGQAADQKARMGSKWTDILSCHLQAIVMSIRNRGVRVEGHGAETRVEEPSIN